MNSVFSYETPFFLSYNMYIRQLETVFSIRDLTKLNAT